MATGASNQQTARAGEYFVAGELNYRTHQAYLKKHGGKRKTTPGSKHHSITTKRIESWKDRWEILGIF